MKLGEILKDLRTNKSELTLEKLAYEYDIPKGTLSKIERGKQKCQFVNLWKISEAIKQKCQFVNLWKISEAIGIKCSDIVKMLEDKLGDDFTLIDE